MEFYYKQYDYPGKKILADGRQLMQSVIQISSALEFFGAVSKKRDDFYDFAEDYYVPAVLICLIYIAVMEYDILVGNGTFILDLLVYASEHILAVSGGLFAAGGILLALSYLLSASLYARREF